MKHMTRKATLHVNQNEGLIFEKSSAGKAAWKLPPLDVPEVDTSQLLGSCTMKYNPRVNEAVARVEGIANGHPYQPEKISQGALQILKTLSECLIDITGMDAITMQPAAGAHGEMTGLLMVRAYHQAQGNARKKILIPDSPPGT